MLASIQKIVSVEPILNADRIEKVKVLGWDCIVKKDLFKSGDLCIYVEIDTVIPKQLLDESYEGDEKITLKTVKMRGQLSQGLVLPLKILEDMEEIFNYGEGWEWMNDDEFIVDEGQDVTDILGVIKYEKQLPPQLTGLAYGNFPSFIPKTDEIRIQSDPSLLEKLKGKEYYITTKLDGTSATFYKYQGHFGVCSRNLELKDGENVYWKMARKYKLDECLPEGFAYQGEICGPGIQKNRLNLDKPRLFIFNMFNIDEQRYFKPHDTELDLVPCEETGLEFNYSLEDLLERAKGIYEGTNNRKEGIVVRSLDQSISFKVINNDFLLKDEE